MDKVEQILKAAQAGDAGRVAALLDEDPALATATSMLGSQPLHAALFGGHDRVVTLLLDRGVAIDPFLAADMGMLKLVEDAVTTDAQFPHAFDRGGSTALHRACYWGQVGVASYLLGRGADPNAPTRDSFLQIRPLGCAVASPDVPNPSDREDIVLALVTLLLEHGAEVNGRRRDGLTALHAAAHRGHTAVIRYLLDHGADSAIRGYEGAGPHAGQTARDMAEAQGQHAAAALLASR